MHEHKDKVKVVGGGKFDKNQMKTDEELHG